MAFPAANGSAFPVALDAAWVGARQAAASLQSQCTTLNAQIAAGNVSGQSIITSLSFFIAINNQLTAYAAVPGIAAYAQQQVNNVSLDVAGAFSGMQAALVAVGNWIVNNFPKDTGGFAQAFTLTIAGPQWATFSTAQLSGLATLLTALSATIN